MVVIRVSRPDDGPRLQEIERLAGQRFREIGLDDVADHEPLPVEAHAEYAAAGRSWVAVDRADELFGFVLVDLVDGGAHVEEISVRPDRQGQGAGRALLEHVRAWAAGHGWPAVTLLTFSDVAWNRPLYEHLGFRVVPDEELGPGLQARREAEAGRGLDPTRRVCMRWDVPR